MSDTGPLPPNDPRPALVPPPYTGTVAATPANATATTAPPAAHQPVAAAPQRGGYGRFLGRALTVAVLAVAVPVLVVFALLTTIALVGTAGSAAKGSGPLAGAELVDGDGGARRVLVVPLTGVIGVQADGFALRDALEAAAEDDDVAAVVLQVDSPGGTVVDSDAIWAGVRAVVKARKPLVAHVRGLSASGAVLATAPATEVWADQGSLVGSIGVRFGPIRQYEGVTSVDDGLFGGGVTAESVDEVYVTAGKYKDLGNPFRPLLPEEAASLQRIVDHEYDRFLEAVSGGRGVERSRLVELGARMFDLPDAMELGLVDRVGTLEAAGRRAAKLAELDEYGVWELPTSSSLLSALGLSAAEAERLGEAGIAKRAAKMAPQLPACRPGLQAVAHDAMRC